MTQRIGRDIDSSFHRRIAKDGAGIILDELVDLCATGGAGFDALAVSEAGRDVEQLGFPADSVQLREALHAASFGMREDVVVVAYHVLPQRLLVWSIRKSGIRLTQLGLRRTVLEREVQRFVELIQSPSDAWRSEATSLFARLLAPVQLTPSDRTVVVVPHRALGVVPFGALLSSQRSFVIDTHELLYAGTVLGGLKDVTGGMPARKALLVAVPDIRNYDPGAPVLRGAVREIERLSSIHERARTLVGSQARKAAVIAALPQYDIVHIAAHGEVNDRTPEASRLQLASDDGTREGGSMYVREIEQLRLRAGSVIVLASCGGARRDKAYTHDWFSLAAAVMRAGAEFVVASQTDLDDDAAVELFTRFHAELVAGAAPPRALQIAQRAFLRSRHGVWQHPRSWANVRVMTL